MTFDFDDLLKAVWEAHKRYPPLRLGQLLFAALNKGPRMGTPQDVLLRLNAEHEAENSHSIRDSRVGHRLFYITDEELAKALGDFHIE